MQHEHGRILVSGALDPRKMISPNFPKNLADFRPIKTQRSWKKQTQMGPSLLSFGLDTGVRSHQPEKRKIPINPVCESLIQAGPIRIFLFSGRYRPEKRKIPINPVCERIYYKQDQLGFSFFPAGTGRKKQIPINPVCKESNTNRTN